MRTNSQPIEDTQIKLKQFEIKYPGARPQMAGWLSPYSDQGDSLYCHHYNDRFDNGTTRSGFEAGMKHTF